MVRITERHTNLIEFYDLVYTKFYERGFVIYFVFTIGSLTR
jgi:hypothetical protein